LILRHPAHARLSANGVNCSLGMTSHFAGGMVAIQEWRRRGLVARSR
jgi:hypothetical protein